MKLRVFNTKQVFTLIKQVDNNRDKTNNNNR